MVTPTKTKKMKPIELRKFLSGLDDFNFRYLSIQMSMAKDARNLIGDFNLTKERFCELMGISTREYPKYLNGGHNYDIKTMATFHCVLVRLRAEQAKEEAEKKLTSINV